MRRFIALSFIFTILMSVAVYAHGTYGIVTGDRVNVRSNGELCDDNRLFQANRGDVVEIHGVEGDFFVATVRETSHVYISREFVRFSETQGTVITPFAWVYNLPSEAGGVPITMFQLGEAVTVTSTYGNWVGVEFNNETAFIEKSIVEIPYFVELPTARIRRQSGGNLADTIIETALQYIGTRYLWGGTTPNGFDCSGFMIYLFTPHDIELNRRSRDQANNGIPVARSELIRGDLVFFGSGRNITHVGMYIGEGQFIHSSTTRTGGVIISNIDADYNTRAFITARRVILD